MQGHLTSRDVASAAVRLPAVDVLVIGAGTAGLAAAAALSAAGKSVCILEARDRIGGRIDTRRDVGLSIPIELGAEFIHGRALSVLSWLARSGSPAIDASETRWTWSGGRLQNADDQFEGLKRGLDAAQRPRTDLPFGEFLEGAARRYLSPRLRRFARTLVEGFDAADADRISTFSVLDEWSGSEAADAPTFRPGNGYRALIDSLHGALDRDCATVRLSSPVSELRWDRGAVTIVGERFGQPYIATAKQAIVTLPLGVLQAMPGTPGAVRFTPALKQKDTALSLLAAGPVVKVLLRFRSPFWETLQNGRYRDGAFFHAPDLHFPTFWSTLPARTPLLTAWAGGKNAARLAGCGEGELVQQALADLDVIFGARARARTHLLAAHFHDWQADPWSRGAYSYLLPGGADARREMTRPVQGTLFFAGEAINASGEAATVTAALLSGERAARQVLAGGARQG